MPVPLTSRYADGHLETTVPDPRGNVRYGDSATLRRSPPIVVRSGRKPTRSTSVYPWKQGDRWDIVASRAGIPRTDWWVVLDSNPQVEFPFALSPGEGINVPEGASRRLL